MIKKMGVFRIFIPCLLCVFLSGCLNVNLKSILPKEVYYSLDNIVLNEPCKKIESNYNASINVLSPYDGKDILVYSLDSQIKTLDTYKWVDLPKNMIRNALMKVGANKCINIEQSVAVGQKISNIRLNINDLYIKEENGSYNAYIYATYEIINYDFTKSEVKSIIISSIDSNPIKALQDSTQKMLNNVIYGISNKKG